MRISVPFVNAGLACARAAHFNFALLVDALGEAPDWLCTPLGTAGNITAYWMGFQEYQQAGHSRTLPRMMGAQASRSAPRANATTVRAPATPLTLFFRLRGSHRHARAILEEDDLERLVRILDRVELLAVGTDVHRLALALRLAPRRHRAGQLRVVNGAMPGRVLIVLTLVATLTELHEPLRLNDNLTIPVFSSVAMQLA